jgi:hypothetical protein
LNIGIVWKNIHGQIDKTIPIDTKELKEYTQNIHFLSKKMKTVINSMTADDYEKQEIDVFYLSAKRITEKFDLPWYGDCKKITIISVILAYFILCIGIEMDKSLIRAYWKKLEIDNPFDRLEYLINKYPLFFKCGPLVEMSYMIKTQITLQNSKSRGMIHDSFHVLYAYYADLFVTGDDHFKKFMIDIDDKAFKNIVLVEDIARKFKNFSS